MTPPLPKSLLWRIGLILIGSQLAIVAVLGWIALAGVRDFHYGQVRDELRRIEGLLAGTYGSTALASPDDLATMVTRDGAQTGVRITLILADGTVIADSEVEPATMENHRWGRAEIEQALTIGNGFATRYSRTLEQDMIYFAQRREWVGVGEVVVRVSLPITRVESRLLYLRALIWIGGAASILLTAIIVYFVSRRLGRQIESLADAATRFSEGDLDYQVAPGSSREFLRLSASLNQMGRQLSSRVTQLQAQQSEQRTILQSMSSGVIALDLEYRVLNINRAAEHLFGVSTNEARGRLLQEMIRHPQLSEFVAQWVLGESPASTEIEIETGTQGRHLIEVTGESLSSPGEPRHGVLLLFNDVTERRRFELLRSDFAANVSHELRTPITNIKGYVETLLEVGWQDQEQAAHFLDIIRTNSDRLAAIVEDVMSLTNLEQFHLREAIRIEEFSTSWMLKTVADQFAKTARTKSIELRIECEDDTSMSGHPALVRQAVANLVSNALRYSPEGSVVTMRTQSRTDEVVIQVIDNGPGIPDKHLARLFERFYRVDKARSRELGGTGLGLAIVKHIAVVHGGRVEVTSVLGEGCTFSMILPMSQQDP